MTAMAIAMGVLTILTLLNLFILFGVIRRLRTMSTSAAEPQRDLLPETGTRVGSFALATTDGRAVTDADLAAGQSLVLMLSPSCGPCQTTAQALMDERALLPERTFVFLRADFEDPELAEMRDKLRRVAAVVEFGATDGVEDAFNSRGYPTAMRIEDGVIAAASFRYAEVLPAHVST